MLNQPQRGGSFFSPKDSEEPEYTTRILLTILRDEHHAEPLAERVSEPERHSRLEAVYRYAEDHCLEGVRVEAAAALAHLSRSRFHQVFREETGVTFIAYLTRLRVEIASVLLREENRTIAGVA